MKLGTVALGLAVAVVFSCSLNRGGTHHGSPPATAGESGDAGETAAGGPGGVEAAGGAGGEAGASELGCTRDEEGRAQCTPGGDLQTCHQGAYQVEASCGEGRCNATRRRCLECAPGQFRCNGAQLEQCNLEGAAYEVVRLCSDEAACVADQDTGFCAVCEPETMVCEEGERDFGPAAIEDGTRPRATLRACTETGWGTQEEAFCGGATPACNSSLGLCLTCHPGLTSCQGNRLLTCNDDGTAIESEEACEPGLVCVNSSCSSPACPELSGEPAPLGRAECRGESLAELDVCGPSGQWERLDSCASMASCNAGTRRCYDDGPCLPGTTRCEAETPTLSICALPAIEDDVFRPEGGSRFVPSRTCVGECVVDPAGDHCGEVLGEVCYPGDSGDACQGDDVCDGQAPESCGACVPGAFRCADGVLSTCAYQDGVDTYMEVGVEDCTPGICDPERGKCLPARPGEYACVAGDRVRVEADASLTTIDSCGSQALCDPVYGCSRPACVDGERVCRGDERRSVLSCEAGSFGSAPIALCQTAERCLDGFGCVRAERVAAGDSHTCALFVGADGNDDTDGLVQCWGANERGQLGNGADLLGDEPQPRPVIFLVQESSAWRLSPRFRRTGLCAGRAFTCADVTLDDEEPGVACWGSNDKGQLGTGTVPGAGSAPVPPSNRILGFVSEEASEPGTKTVLSGVSHVTCGAEFACALDAEGNAYCWGGNGFGQLGVGQTNDVPSPLARAVTGGHHFTVLEAGGRHACGIDDEGTILCWGDDRAGQVGEQVEGPVPEPFPAPGLSSGEGVALGRDFTLSLRAAAVSSWGANFFGQLGNGNNVASTTPSAAVGLGDLSPDRLFAGPTAAHACALRGDALHCWGANPLGQVGDGTLTDRYTPVATLDAPGLIIPDRAGAVALGKGHGCAVDGGGAIWCWGSNRRGQVGPPSLGSSVPEPRKVY